MDSSYNQMQLARIEYISSDGLKSPQPRGFGHITRSRAVFLQTDHTVNDDCCNYDDVHHCVAQQVVDGHPSSMLSFTAWNVLGLSVMQPAAADIQSFVNA